MRSFRVIAGASAVAAVLMLAGCGGSASSTSVPSVSEPSTTTTASPAARTGGPRMDPAEMQKISQCLEAAGISVPTPSGMAGRTPPSGPPLSGPPPSGAAPSGAPGGLPAGAGGRGGLLDDPKVKAALEACGLSLPAAPSGAAPPASS
jgi:hypothetical protein